MSTNILQIPTDGGGQLPVRSQEASLEARRTRTNKGNHETCQPAGTLSGNTPHVNCERTVMTYASLTGRIYGGRGPTEAGSDVPLLASQPQPKETD